MKNSNQSKRFRPKYHVKKGDTVKVLSGNDKGKEGRVLHVDTKTGRAIVEGIRIMKHHTKPSATNPQGGIIPKEALIPICKLMVIDPSTGKPSRVGRKIEDGNLVRYAKKSGEIGRAHV